MRSGREWGKRPVQSLFEDDWAGHRTLFGEPVGDKAEWTDWDYALKEAIQTIEDFTDSNGQLVWEVEEDGVRVESVKYHDKFQASIDRKTSRPNYKPDHGERWRPQIRPNPSREDGEFQTFKQWRESKQ